ncbi:signal peptidase complex subunit 1-like [Teleopsis dalmanni]|uniref:signal peptidase complex subunit 1-like n=1 Tax=Teleopsis dalmanni TaxID=139649 RepID=UPI0018CCDBA5|nr:signal peptidase complex subunit 1-like [Teleopsis dalmanni]
MCDICKKIKSKIWLPDTYVDYVGQAYARWVLRFIMILFASVGFAWGAIIEDFSQTLIILAAAYLFSALMIIPPWPMYRRNSLQWRKLRSKEKSAVASSKKRKKKKRRNNELHNKNKKL